ncbi:MAG: hypothetical protein JSV21_00915, partial [Nitrospirota bacterium]
YYGDDITLEDVVDQVKNLESGGTLAVFLACHALRRGYTAKIYTYNLNVFDPSWFSGAPVDMVTKLRQQMKAKSNMKLHVASKGYIEFVQNGGEIKFEDLTTGLIRKYLKRSVPILAGLSATYLYRTQREHGPNNDWDDIRGVPSGHFVVLCGYDKKSRNVLIADPLKPNPFSSSHYYEVSIDRVLCSLLLGVLTYDANLLIINPARHSNR